MQFLCKDISCYSRQEYINAYKMLSASKKKRIDAISDEQRKKQSLAAVIAVAELLEQSFCLNDTVIENKENGQPFVKGSNLHISISHSKNIVAVAADTNPVGIDVEFIRPINFSLVKRVCDENELNYVVKSGKFNEDRLITDNQILTRFFEVWTAEEALFKASGGRINSFKNADVFSLNTTKITQDGYCLQIVSL